MALRYKTEILYAWSDRGTKTQWFKSMDEAMRHARWIIKTKSAAIVKVYEKDESQYNILLDWMNEKPMESSK